MAKKQSFTNQFIKIMILIALLWFGRDNIQALFEFTQTTQSNTTSVSPAISSLSEDSSSYNVSRRKILRVLFIGNSYTYCNDMPKIFEELASHDPDGRFRIETEMFVQGGATLSLLLNRPEATKALNKKQWDYVVLQPQSMWAMANERAKDTEKALKAWNLKIKKIGATPVFFMTWPRQPRTHWYTGEKRAFLKSPQNMYNHIQHYSYNFQKRYHVILAPVGKYWTKILAEHPTIKLYDTDGSHPSSIGSYMTALLFYKMLANNTLSDITYYPNYLTSKEQNAIIKTISKAPTFRKR